MRINTEKIGSLTLSPDRWEIARAELLVSSFSTVYISAAEHVPFFSWQMVRAVEHTGFTEISPFCLLCFTFPLLGLGHYEEPYHIGRMGETLVKEKENHPYGSKVHTWFSGFLVSWKAPIEGMLEGCREGVAAGERSGDFEYASYSFALLTGCRLIYTMPLDEAHRLNEDYIARTLEMKQDRNVSAGDFGRAVRPALRDEEHTAALQEEWDAPQPASSSFFDRVSLLETSRVITADEKPEALLSGLLEIFIKTSGATRGFLFLTEGKKRFPASIVAAKNKESTLWTKYVTADKSGQLPSSLALRVFRTGETILYKSESGSDFFNDPYLRGKKPKAFYCRPLRHKDSVPGILYLENDLNREFFSPGTVETVDILTAQAAVALDNFRLYSQLLEKMQSERRLEEENRDNLEKLMQAEKMATLGLLTSEIGHEINNMIQPLRLAAEQMEAVESDLTALLGEIADTPSWEGAAVGGLSITEACTWLPEVISTIRKSSGQIIRLAAHLRGYYREEDRGSASAAGFSQLNQKRMSVPRITKGRAYDFNFRGWGRRFCCRGGDRRRERNEPGDPRQGGKPVLYHQGRRRGERTRVEHSAANHRGTPRYAGNRIGTGKRNDDTIEASGLGRVDKRGAL
jgi:hypothetical protein